MGNLIDKKNSRDGEPRTDFEKLVIAKIIIKQQGFDKGVLESEVDELKHKIQKLKETASPFTGMTKEEKLEIKREQIYKDLRAQITKVKKQNKQIKRDNSDLIYKLHHKINE